MRHISFLFPSVQLIRSLLTIAILLSLISTAQAQRKKKFKTSRDIEVTANKSPKISVTADNATDIAINAPKAQVSMNQPKPGSSIELSFKSNGQLYSNPPETLYPGENIMAKVELDEAFWNARINSTLSSWISALENLNKYAELNESITYGITETELNTLKEEMAYKISQLITNSGYLSTDLKNYYTQKLNLLGIRTNVRPGASPLTPDLEALFTPEYTIEYFFYDEKKVRINKNGSVFCAGDKTIYPFKPCEEDKLVGMYQADGIALPPNCYEVRYELRLAYNLHKVMVAWANNLVSKFPSTYTLLAKDITDKLNTTFLSELDLLVTDVKKLSKDPLDPSVKLDEQLQFADKGLAFTKNVLDRLNSINGNDKKEWVLRWLWLTNGLPRINPFDPGVLVPAAMSGKVSAQDKALYQVFENMVNKGAVKITELNELDSDFKNIPRIKAALDGEAAQAPNEPQQLDRLLYQGLLKATTGAGVGKIYMRHIDLMNNYTIMNNHPVKEITENDRMHILAENKTALQKLTSTFETVAIGPEDSRFATLLKETNTAADIFDERTANINADSMADDEQTRLAKATALIAKATQLFKEIAALKTLSQLPVLPLSYAQDKTPDLVTLDVAHDYLYQAPVTAKYSIKQVNADNTEKELVSGNYRINRLYRFRLKAGLVYSFLRKTDYTLAAPNQYTIDDSRFGIDGTFGVQAFFKPQDIRSDKCAFRPFVYVGFSMKKISENFYIGLGSEPFNGISIGINAHIGKREALTGNANTATSIKGTWAIDLAPMILVDPSLFVRLFTFNSTNRSLLSF